MKRFLVCILTLLVPFLVLAQQHSIEIDASSFKPVHTDPLTGVAIDKIERDYSKRPCARIKLHINRMSREEIEGISVKVIGGNVVVMKRFVAAEGTGLIIELTAKPQTSFYLHHDKYGDSNKVTLDLEGDKEYRLEAQRITSHTIVVSSNVVDAEVFVDDTYKGQIGANFMLSINQIQPGQHKIKVQSGQLVNEETVDVNSLNVSFRLELNQAQAQPQYAVFKVEPKEASVTVDGKPLMVNDGVALSLLGGGSHSYTISANEYYTEKGTFVIDGAKVVKNIKLRPAFGFLTIPANEDLSGASVYVDNSLVGKAPISNHKIANGTHSIRIVKDLYKANEGTIVVKEGEVTEYAPTLVADYAYITLTTGAGFEIYVNNELKGKSSWSGRVSIGTQIFEARKEGYRPSSITRAITLDSRGQSFTIPTPRPITGALNITSTPIMAEVRVDGTLVGETPIMLNLTIGKHTISVNKEGYSNSIEEVDVVEGQVKDLNITLNRGIKILYTSSDGRIITPQEGVFDANIVSNTYVGGQGIIEFDKSITKIADFGFKNCTTLTSIVIPDRVTTIGFEAFYNCTSLQKIVIGNGVTSFGRYAFSGCKSLSSVEIRNGITEIGVETFRDCKSLKSIVIPNSVKTIGQKAFYGCSGLTSVTIGSGVTSIGEQAFYGCSGLTSVTIGSGVTSIGEQAFYECSSFTSITIPDSVTSIQEKAFYGCSGLTSITIGSGVTSIGDDAFAKCGEMSVHITDLSAWCKIDFKNQKANPLGCGNYCHELFINGKQATNITIPSDITIIKKHTFDCCISLRNLVIPNTVTTIETRAFAFCRDLSSVSFGTRVETIGESAFRTCDDLTRITIPDSVTTIGQYAFYNCSSLLSVTIGKGISDIGYEAFRNCEALNSVYCKATTPSFLKSNVFYDNANNRKIYVPTASVGAYKQSYIDYNYNRWSEYSDSIVGYDF